MKRLFPILLLLIFAANGLQSQNEPIFDIKNPGDAKEKRCRDYFEVVQSIPPEIRYTVTERDGILYLVFNSKEYFNLIFDQKNDGFAIDIISKDQYKCETPNQHSNSWAHKGTLMPPLYKETFASLVQVANNGVLVIRYAELPPEFDPKEVEYNLLIIQKNYLCDNRYFYNIDFDTWSLLPTGLYRDTVQNTEAISKYTDLQKTMHFTVPFKKDQTVFNQADVKPVYDSLNLTDYVIKRISINAFSSVEGPLDRNIRLQEGRAQSIVDVLKAYQNESIQSEITANENWAEFEKDIKGTDFAYLGDMTKAEVKAKFEGNTPLLEQIEPILGKHRKAQISIELEKRINPENSSPEMLKQLFAQSIAEKNKDEALYLQNLIFKSVREKRLPESLIGELEIPESIDYGGLFNNRAVFYTELHPEDLQKGIDGFSKLLKFLPNNIKVQYNLATLKMKQWSKSEQQTRRRDVLNMVTALERKGLDAGLLRTLKVNYHIVLTKYLNAERNFAMKNRSLRFIYNEYRRVSLTDEELLRLAKYMTYYSRFDWAESLMKTRVQQEGVSTDILFYYLNLTITNPSKTRRPDYQQVLDRAAGRDQERFCKLFRPKSQGGITFQLLDDINLKKKFCAQCSSLPEAKLAVKNTGN